jgi:hypothetical protein
VPKEDRDYVESVQRTIIYEETMRLRELASKMSSAPTDADPTVATGLVSEAEVNTDSTADEANTEDATDEAADAPTDSADEMSTENDADSLGETLSAGRRRRHGQRNEGRQSIPSITLKELGFATHKLPKRRP